MSIVFLGDYVSTKIFVKYLYFNWRDGSHTENVVEMSNIDVALKAHKQCTKSQARRQNLKAVPQNFMEVFKVDDVTTNDVIQKKQHLLRNEKLDFPQ